MRLKVLLLIIGCAAFLFSFPFDFDFSRDYKGYNVSAYYQQGIVERKNLLKSYSDYDYFFVMTRQAGASIETSIPIVPFSAHASLEFLASYENDQYPFYDTSKSNLNEAEEWVVETNRKFPVNDQGFQAAFGVSFHPFTGKRVEFFLGADFKLQALWHSTNIYGPREIEITTNGLTNYKVNADEYYSNDTVFMGGPGVRVFTGIMLKIVYPFYVTLRVGMDFQYLTDGTDYERNRETGYVKDEDSFKPSARVFLHREFYCNLGVAIRLPWEGIKRVDIRR